MNGDGGGGLDLERRLADGEAAITLAIIRWVHACAEVTAERLHWRICQLRGAGWRDLEVTTAEHWRRAAVRCAHEAHELERLLDARDTRRRDLNTYLNEGVGSRYDRV